MRVAALTGMRREEIGQLRLADCAGGVFIVQQGKTAAARLQNIVELVGHTQTSTSSMAAAFGTLSTNLTAVLAKVGQLDNIMESIADLKDNQTTMLEEMVDRTGPSLLTRVLLLEADIRELKHQIRELKRDRDRP